MNGGGDELNEPHRAKEDQDHVQTEAPHRSSGHLGSFNSCRKVTWLRRSVHELNEEQFTQQGRAMTKRDNSERERERESAHVTIIAVV